MPNLRKEIAPEQVNLRLKQHPSYLDESRYSFEKNEFWTRNYFNFSSDFLTFSI